MKCHSSTKCWSFEYLLKRCSLKTSARRTRGPPSCVVRLLSSLAIGYFWRRSIQWFVNWWRPFLIHWKWRQLMSPFQDCFWLVLRSLCRDWIGSPKAAVLQIVSNLSTGFLHWKTALFNVVTLVKLWHVALCFILE